MTDKLNDLAKVLQRLKLESRKCIGAMVPIMENIDDADSTIIEEVKYICEIKEEKITKWIQNYTLRLVEDAETVFKQVDEFAEVAPKGDKHIMKTKDKYPFLAEVWFGDVYDGKSKIEALEALSEDIRENIDKATEENIIQETINHFVKKNVEK